MEISVDYRLHNFCLDMKEVRSSEKVEIKGTVYFDNSLFKLETKSIEKKTFDWTKVTQIKI